MNGFAALDIHPHRRYVVDIGGRRSSRCRLHINFALFLHSLDFTQNLGVSLGYNQVPDITRCSCWAHLRRKCLEGMPAASINPKGLLTPAQIGRDYCDQLFAAEKKLAELPAEERQKQRLAVEKPMLRAFWCWLEELEQQPLAGNLKKA